MTSPVMGIRSDGADAAGPITWRQLASNLWVGRLDDRHAGSIERSHGYTFIDPDGGVSASMRTLDGAQSAAVARATVPPTNGPFRPALLLTGATVLALAAIGSGTMLAAAALLHLS